MTNAPIPFGNLKDATACADKLNAPLRFKVGTGRFVADIDHAFGFSVVFFPAGDFVPTVHTGPRCDPDTLAFFNSIKVTI